MQSTHWPFLASRKSSAVFFDRAGRYAVRMENGQRARRRLRLSHLSALRLTQQRQKVLERIKITLDIQSCFLSIVFDR